MESVTKTGPATVRELRLFAGTVAISIGAIAGLLVPVVRRHELPLWPWVTAGLILLLGIFVPRSLRGAHAIARQLRDRVASIQTRVVLTVVYFLIIVPLGVLMQLLQKRDRKRRNTTTYRLPSAARSKSSLEKPF